MMLEYYNISNEIFLQIQEIPSPFIFTNQCLGNLAYKFYLVNSNRGLRIGFTFGVSYVHLNKI